MYLPNWPQKVTEHVMDRLVTAGDYSLEDMKPNNENGEFLEGRCLAQYCAVTFATPKCYSATKVTSQECTLLCHGTKLASPN